jgi:Flp pilus assembly protein TadB
VLVALGAILLVGVPAGILVGAAVGLGVRLVVPRLQSETDRRREHLVARQAPLVVDLLAACLASGAAVEDALEASARAVGEPTSDLLLTATAALRLGADPLAVWRTVGQLDQLGGLARAAARSHETGAPLAELLPRVADDVRSRYRAQVEARTRTAGVRLMAPLGIAFLPAFVLLGVVPVVASWVGVLW